MTGGTNVLLGLSCILQAEPTLASCKCWKRHWWTTLLEWYAMHCLKCIFLLPKRNTAMSVHAFNLLQTKLHVLLMFCAIYLSGAEASTKHGLSSLLR